MKQTVSRWIKKTSFLPEIFKERLMPGNKAQASSGAADQQRQDPLQTLAIHSRLPLATLPPVIAHLDPAPWIDLSTVPMEQTMDDYIARDSLPLPPTINREGYHGERHHDYWLSGLKDYLRVKQILQRHNIPFTRLQRSFELGCATGRVLRHFICQEPQIEVWGADINLSHVTWALQHLGASPKIFQSSMLPYLPLEDNSMDLVSAFSVFTHIDEFELAWLAEVRRILKPGGIAYLTVHTNHTWRILNDKHALYHGLRHIQPFIHNYTISPELFAKPMPEARIAFKWEIDGVRSANLFYTQEYLHDIWGRFFKVLEIVPEASDYQDVVLLQKL
jgi:SAM-dependent methyltransferase